MRALTPKVCAARAPRVVGASRVDRVRWSCPPPVRRAAPRHARPTPVASRLPSRGPSPAACHPMPKLVCASLTLNSW